MLLLILLLSLPKVCTGSDDLIQCSRMYIAMFIGQTEHPSRSPMYHKAKTGFKASSNKHDRECYYQYI